MLQKEQAVQEIYARCTAELFEKKLITTLELRPQQSLTGVSACPAVLLWEANDNINERHSSTGLGYPARRVAELIVEVWSTDRSNLTFLFNRTRAAVLGKDGLLVDESVSIREARAVGPLNHPVPTIEGHRIFFELYYTDNGPDYEDPATEDRDPATGLLR